MPDLGWARSRGSRAEQQGLRRGAWYRVVEDDRKEWVVLDVHLVQVRVPRADLEVRAAAPRAWSVVRQPHLVCPGCHARRVLPDTPAEARCPECGRIYPVDWKDEA